MDMYFLITLFLKDRQVIEVRTIKILIDTTDNIMVVKSRMKLKASPRRQIEMYEEQGEKFRFF